MTSPEEVGAPALTAGEHQARMPISSFYWRILGLIAAGLFVDVYDQVTGGGGATARARGCSTGSISNSPTLRRPNTMRPCPVFGPGAF